MYSGWSSPHGLIILSPNQGRKESDMKQLLLPGICGQKTEEDPGGYIFVRHVRGKNGRIIWPRKGSVLRISLSRLRRTGK